VACSRMNFNFYDQLWHTQCMNVYSSFIFLFIFILVYIIRHEKLSMCIHFWSPVMATWRNLLGL